MSTTHPIQIFEQMIQQILDNQTSPLIETIEKLQVRINHLETQMQKAYLTQKEVCKNFGIGHRTLKLWVSKGLNEIWIDNRVFYDRNDIKEYMNLHKI